MSDTQNPSLGGPDVFIMLSPAGRVIFGIPRRAPTRKCIGGIEEAGRPMCLPDTSQGGRLHADGLARCDGQARGSISYYRSGSGQVI